MKKDDSPLIVGYQIYHNYLRPHMGLDDKTPSEKTEIEVKGITSRYLNSECR